MSHQDVLKAELKARRSSRELGHGLEHLGEKVIEGASRAMQLKIQAGEIASKVRHPKDAVFAYFHQRSRSILFGVGASVVVLGLVIFVRSRKELTVSNLPSEALRYSKAA